MSGAGSTRRRVFAAVAMLSVASPAALTGCTLVVPAPEVPDPLEAPARRAEADATQANAVAQLAAGTDPALAAAATALATDRRTHAAALRAEIRRVRPKSARHGSARHGSAQHSSPPVARQPATPERSGARGVLAQAARAADDEAAGLVMTLPGYRAALLASIAACCASHAALLS